MTPADALLRLRALGCGARWCVVFPGAPGAPQAGCRCLHAVPPDAVARVRQAIGLWQVAAGVTE